ncbi:uncharacterized protein LOC143793567 [Ranitomeya variabilis]|uniref:uncharacterized protein LOC143793567 n=1 Tax=Ranitomeya variabilis TaxID=490064 RepID=UPI004055FD3E
MEEDLEEEMSGGQQCMNVVKEETPDVTIDGSRRRRPRPLYPQDGPEENHNIPEDHQKEDLISIKEEEDLEEAMSGGQQCMNVVKEETPDVTTAFHSNMSSTEDLGAPQSGQDTNEHTFFLRPAARERESVLQQITGNMSDSEGSSSSMSAFFSSQSESSEPEAARPPQKKQAKPTKVVAHEGHKRKKVPRRLSSPKLPVDTSGAEQPEQLSDDSSQGRRARVPEVERRRVPQREEANTIIDNDQLIHLVKERVALWDTSHRQHSDSVVIRRLWEEVARLLLANWDRATTQVRKDFLKSVKVRWRSIKDRFNKDMREEIKVQSCAAPKLSKYKYHRMLAFLRPALAHRTTCSSTTEPGSSSVAAALHRPATERSQSSTSNAATGQASQAGEQAACPSGFPLSQPSSTAFVGTSRQRQRAWERSVMPEFIHLSSVFQDGMKVIGDRIDSGFTQVNTLLQDVHRHLDRLKADLRRPVHHFFLQ